MSGEGRTKKLITEYYILISTIFALDQVSKYCAVKFIPQGASVPVIDNVFHLTMVHNTGCAFGLFRGYPFFFVVAAVFALIAANYLLLAKTASLNVGEVVGICLISGGTLGNLVDRLWLSYVVDFLDFRIWPVFNIADSCISIGAFVFLAAAFLKIKKETVIKR